MAPSPVQTSREVLSQLSDEDLMSQFQAGVVEALNLLIDRYTDRLMHYLYGFTRDAKACEDLVQETFVRVYRNRHSYRRIASFSTWVYTIAGNLARSEYRRRRRWRFASIHPADRSEEAYELPLPDAAPLPDHHAEGALQRRYIQEALFRLPPAYREVVVLRDVQQLAYSEIAQITGLPLGTVKSRINRGRVKLQGLLRAVYPFLQPGGEPAAVFSE